MVKIKVCGITNLEDALAAVELGADYLGFNFYPPSPRAVGPEQARAILRQVPPGVGTFALFVNETKEKILRILESGARAYTGVQLHGDESADFCRGFDLKVIKAFRAKDRDSLAGMEGFPADYYLVDSLAPGYGGTGPAVPLTRPQPVLGHKAN